MSREEILRAIEKGVKTMKREPSKVQIAFKNGCNYTLNHFQGVLKHCDDLQQRIDKAVDILSKYRHYSTPTEEQNSENEDYVDNALEILKGDSND